MKFIYLLFAVTVVLIQWKCASTRYLSPSSHISRPRSTFYGDRLRGQTSVNQQRQSIYARRNTVSPHSNRHQRMSYRTHRQQISDPATRQQEPRISKITQNTLPRVLITKEEDDRAMRLSLGTGMAHRRRLRVRNHQQLARRPVSRQQYQSSNKLVRRYRKPMHNIFIRTKTGRQIRISHSLGRTNIVLNTDSISKQNPPSYLKYPLDQRKRISGSYRTLNNRVVSPLVDTEKDTYKVWNETISPVLHGPKQTKQIIEYKITADSIADMKVLNEINNPEKVSLPAIEQTANIISSMTNNTVSPSINTSTTLDSTVSLVRNKTVNQETKGNENNVHTSMSYIHEGQTTSTRTPSSSSITQVNSKDITKSTIGPIVEQTKILRGINKEPAITSTNTSETPTTLTSSSTTGDDGSVDLPDSITEDIDGIDTPDTPDIAD